jgi:hypothetical protein
VEVCDFITTNLKYVVGFEAVTAVVMKSSSFWNIMLCNRRNISRSSSEMDGKVHPSGNIEEVRFDYA